MPETPTPTILYRIVETNPPTSWDFTSNEARGRPLHHPTPEKRRLWAGLSMFANEDRARRNARKFPALGSYIARLMIPDSESVQVERTLGPGHYTVWGTPSYVLTFVAEVFAVD